MTDGLWVLPTRNRPENLKRFLKAAKEIGTSTPGLILVNQDEWEARKADYDALQIYLLPNWRFLPVQAESYGGSIRAVWDRVRDLRWVGLVSDDLVPCTPGWDVKLVSYIQGWNVVSSNDGWQAQTGDIQKDRVHGAICFSGDLLRAIGWMFPPGLKHIFHDDMIEALGRETACWQVKPDILVKHLHEALQGIRGPTMDPNSDLWKHDEALFRKWLEDERPQTVERIKQLMLSKNVVAMKPDLTGVRLMIGTPCGSGRYEGDYMRSWFETVRFMTAQGIETRWAEEKYTADISLARSKIFAAFIKSNCTHLLMIDDDMDWKIDAVIRLFCAKKDFVSIAGPKKRYPLAFAVNYTDDFGNPLNLAFDSASGTMEVTEVGSAFCLITRACAEKMRDGYPELEYIGATGEPEWYLFCPMVMNRRPFSEDFAFCLRWRKLGGKVYVVPDIPLGHTGIHRFHGSMQGAINDQLAAMAEMQRQAAE